MSTPLDRKKLPDITVRRLWNPLESDMEAVAAFFSQSLVPPLEFLPGAAFVHRICAYSLLKERLAACFPDMEQVVLKYGANGKPSIAAPDAAVFFNVSHSGDYVMCGIARSEIGVDIQKKRTVKPETMRLIAPELSESGINLMDGGERTKVFCRKESALKAFGGSVLGFFSEQGLNVPPGGFLETFEVLLPDPEYAAYYSLYKTDCSRSVG